MPGKTEKDFELIRAQLRKLYLESSNSTSDWISTNREENESVNSNFTFDSFQRLLDEIEYNRATAQVGTSFAKVFTVLGLVTLCINLIILVILISHRRLLLRQVFYLLIINFAIIDVLKGVCLASHALRFITPPSVYQDRNVLATRIDQYVVIFFRLFNLATIFNLLLITLNEFIYIKFPLRYHQLIRRRLMVGLVFTSWIISILFTLASSLAKTKDDTVLVSMDSNNTDGEEVSYKDKSPLRTSLTSHTDLHTILTFALTGFCVFSLFVVLVCYAVFFNVIRHIQKHDRQLYIDSNIRRPSECSVECAGDMQHLDDRKLKRQLLRRYKYVLVIGSVILVYMLYLISYSIIQILQYFNLSRHSAMNAEKMRHMLFTRWTLVLLCGLHSTIQPICYFRMKEFREIVIRIFGCSGKFGIHKGERSGDHHSSMVEVVTPLTTACHTPQPAHCNGNENKIASSMKQRQINSDQSNGVRSVRRQSVVHFDERSLLVSTLNRNRCQLTHANNLL